MNTPKFPKIKSLQGRALARLLKGKKFTHREFQNWTSSYRLSAYIEKLRNEKFWPIESILETTPTNDSTGRRVTYARYFMAKPEIDRTINVERIRRFCAAVDDFESWAAAHEQENARGSNFKATKTLL